MRDLLACLTALAVLGIAQYLTATAYVLFLIVLLMSATVRPGVTFAFIASVGALVLAFRAPAATAGAVALIMTASVVTGHVLRAKARQRGPINLRPTPPPLPRPGEIDPGR